MYNICMNIEKDIFLINKPKGITSFDVIRKLRKKTGIKKIGHAGTLDPLVHGLLIIGINDGTKKLNSYLKLPKTYIADILLGEKRDTGDLEGKIIEEEEVSFTDFGPVEKVLFNMKGIHKLPVPKYSAIKIDGKPLYKYMREEGKPPKIPIKEMEIIKIHLLDHFKQKNKYILRVEMRVSSGSYIRSLVEEIGNRVGYPATLFNLQRTNIGKYALGDAKEIDKFVI